MHAIDWLIMILPLLICGSIAVYSQRYVRSVADFMAGGRNAGRFLLCTARSEQGAGAVVFVAMFQGFYISGFSLRWWGQLSVPIFLLISIFGFVIYRYRQTRALTLGQFFETRYSRKFRLFTGGLGFVAGILNFGIIPVLGAKFMVYFLELPQRMHLFAFEIPTYLLLMTLFLTLCVVMTTTGGQISVMLTDCAEGMFSQLFYTFIAITLLIMFFKWADTKAMLLDTPPTKSLVNPFDSFGLHDFNIWLVIMGIFSGVYRSIAWQNSHGFNASAASPHEARMGGILGRWREFAQGVMVTLLAVCAMTYLKSPHGATAVNTALATVVDPSTRDQMRMPVALSQFLPIGVKGALISICLMGIIAGDGMHLHSWGSILIQDVIMPLRKKPLSTRQHLRLLRLSIVGVAVWALIFGAIFPQTKYVQFWWGVTEAIFIGGAGIAVIGGLYWNRGTTAGAWAGLLVGSTLSVGGILADLYCRTQRGHDFFLNGPQIGFFSGLAAISTYGLVSWLTCRTRHNMDALLHRGQYSVEPKTLSDPAGPPSPRLSWVNRIIGIDEHFNRFDRWITFGIFGWSMFWFGLFVIGSVICLLYPVANSTWAGYWLITNIYLPALIGAVTTIWFTIGCWRDMRVFFRRLREETVDEQDDGTVHHPDLPTANASPPVTISSRPRP